MDKTAEVLAQLREDRARLRGELAGVERAIAALEGTTGVQEPAPVAPAPQVEAPRLPALAPLPPPPPPGPYTPLGFYEAAALYLREAGEPKTAREIADALLAGGYRTDSANFRAVARTMLQRPFSARPYGIDDIPDGRYICVRAADWHASS